VPEQGSKCAHGCGRDADKYSSGMLECWPCWNIRKLEGPAADHWARVGQAFLSNVDVYDMTEYFQLCGLTNEEASTMLKAAAKVTSYSQKRIKAGFGPIDEESPVPE